MDPTYILMLIRNHPTHDVGYKCNVRVPLPWGVILILIDEKLPLALGGHLTSAWLNGKKASFVGLVRDRVRVRPRVSV